MVLAAEPALAPARAALTVDDYVDGVLSGNRAMLGRAITMIESKHPKHHDTAQEILLRLLADLQQRPEEKRAHRIGITGVPGVGKSTFIESFGVNLIKQHSKRIAVLAVDPSSSVSGGSILGDKTRMAELSQNTEAFIRPSPTAGSLGGVARATRAAMIVCEAAGYDLILIETVGAGQNEVTVSEMTDFFLVLMLPGAGDELQGIKKGILELADMLVVNKADGDNERRAKQAKIAYRNALHIMRHTSPNWEPPVLTCSALNNEGLDKVWEKLREHKERLTETGEIPEKRRRQRVRWLWATLENRLMDSFRVDPEIMAMISETEEKVADGHLTVSLAVDQLIAAYHKEKHIN